MVRFFENYFLGLFLFKVPLIFSLSSLCHIFIENKATIVYQPTMDGGGAIIQNRLGVLEDN